MTGRPSRLWRKLGAATNVFEVYSPVHGLLKDDRLANVTVTRGGGSSPSGLAVSTCTFRTKGALSSCPSDRTLVRYRLTNYGRNLVSALCGRPASEIGARFEGRIASQTVSDLGDHAVTRWSTEVQCSEWLSLLSTLDRGATATTANPGQNYILDSLIRRSALPVAQIPTPLAFFGTNWHRRYFAADEPGTLSLTTSDALDTWADKLGALIRTTRGGQPQLLALDYRAAQALAWRSGAPQPLLRSQCLAPVSWSQDPTVPRSVTWTDRDPGNPDNVTIEHTISVGNLGDVDAWPNERLDLTTVIPVGAAGLNDAMTARVFRSVSTGYQVERLRVDLLGLLASDRPADTAQAGQLLAAEIGGPITLAYDWPDAVAGIKFITGMTETITPDEWTLELELSAWGHVTGQHPDPDAAGATWDTAYRRSTTWDAVPSATAWNGAP